MCTIRSQEFASVDYLIASANIAIEENVSNPWIVMASVFQLIQNKVGNFRFSLHKKKWRIFIIFKKMNFFRQFACQKFQSQI